MHRVRARDRPCSVWLGMCSSQRCTLHVACCVLQAVQHVAGDLQLAMPPIIATDWTADSIVHDESMLMVPLARPPSHAGPHTPALISLLLARSHAHRTRTRKRRCEPHGACGARTAAKTRTQLRLAHLPQRHQTRPPLTPARPPFQPCAPCRAVWLCGGGRRQAIDAVIEQWETTLAAIVGPPMQRLAAILPISKGAAAQTASAPTALHSTPQRLRRGVPCCARRS
jgi:hypothetical protein